MNILQWHYWDSIWGQYVHIILTVDHVNLDRGPGELCCAVAGNGAGVVAAVGRRRAPDPQPGENVLGLHLGADAEIKDNFDLDCLKLFYLVKTQDACNKRKGISVSRYPREMCVFQSSNGGGEDCLTWRLYVQGDRTECPQVMEGK